MTTLKTASGETHFETKLRPIGNATGTTISNKILEEAGLKVGDDVRISASDKAVKIEKIDSKKDRVKRLHQYSKMRFAKVYEELAK